MKHLLLPLLLALATTTVVAQSDTSNTTTVNGQPTATMDTSAYARVYVIRSTGHAGSAINLRMVVDDVTLCKIKNNRYAMVLVQPGSHQFNATSWDKPSAAEKFALKMEVEAGKTYYMSMHLKQKFVGIEIYLEEITYNTAAPLMAKYKKDECN